MIASRVVRIKPPLQVTIYSCPASSSQRPSENFIYCTALLLLLPHFTLCLHSISTSTAAASPSYPLSMSPTCCTADLLSKCCLWCSIRWFFWKNALPHSHTCARTVHCPSGCLRVCCNRPFFVANPLLQCVQKCDLGFGITWIAWIGSARGICDCGST